MALDIPQPVDVLFDYFAEHENQAKIFSIRVERLRDGDGSRNGVGSKRRLHSPPLAAFEETITAFEPNRRIEYRMSNSWKNPIKDHLGVIVFSPSPVGTRLAYTIDFVARVPFLGGAIRTMTERNLRKGLDALAARTPGLSVS